MVIPESESSRKRPAISVIIPSHNRKEQLKECLYSIFNQNYSRPQDIEVIVINDGSNDGTELLLDKISGESPFIFKFFNQMKSGSYSARNFGIKNSKGNVICFTDDDCIANEDWLKELIKGFENQDVGCVCGEILGRGGTSLVDRFSSRFNILSQKRTLSHEFLPFSQTANTAYRREVFDAIGYFDENLVSGGDADFGWRMQIYTNFKLVFNEDAVVYHKHRTTLKGLFRQYFRYGYGSVLLYKKYRTLGKMKKDLREVVKGYLVPIVLTILFVKNCIIRLVRIKPIDNLSLFIPLLSLISSVSYRLGRLYGSVKGRVFYP